jgi:hypothetical protein
MMQKVNVSHGKPKMDQKVRRRDLPCIRGPRPFYRKQFVRGVVPMSMDRKKGKKKRRRSKQSN